MPKGTITEDTTTLHMALVGYEMEKARIDEKIAEIRAHLGHSSSPVSTSVSTKKSAPVSASASNSTAPATKKRTMSAAARKRIAAAQRKRWAEHRKNLAAGS